MKSSSGNMNSLRASEPILANANRIQTIELDDLIYLERDLAFDEKVEKSLGFVSDKLTEEVHCKEMHSHSCHRCH